MEKALVNPSHGTVPLRLLNLSSEPQCLYQRAVAATAELVERVTEFETNSCYPQPCDLDKNNVSLIQDYDPSNLPEHLQNVLDASVGTLTDKQKGIFFNLLVKLQHVFAKFKYGLGRTDLVLHEIDTGDHRPIKQPVIRLPLHKRELVEQEVPKKCLKITSLSPLKAHEVQPLCSRRKRVIQKDFVWITEL